MWHSVLSGTFKEAKKRLFIKCRVGAGERGIFKALGQTSPAAFLSLSLNELNFVTLLSCQQRQGVV